MVHGKYFNNKIDNSQLGIARDFARRVILWFIHYLAEIQNRLLQIDDPKHIPSRKDILRMLDMKESERENKYKLIGTFPAGFPHIPEWIKL